MRERHRAAVEEARTRLDGSGALSRQGLNQAVENLSDVDGLINSDDKSILEKLIDTRFCSGALGTVRDTVVGLFTDLNDRVDDRVGQVTKAVVSIACDSLDYALEQGDVDDTTEFLTPVCHDVRGALDGAALGARLVPGLAPHRIAAAALGALVGGASASIIGFLGESDGADSSPAQSPAELLHRFAVVGPALVAGSRPHFGPVHTVGARVFDRVLSIPVFRRVPIVIRACVRLEAVGDDRRPRSIQSRQAGFGTQGVHTDARACPLRRSWCGAWPAGACGLFRQGVRRGS